MARVIRFIIAGAVGALIGWAIIEPIDALTPRGGIEVINYGAMVALGLIVGFCIGTALGIAEVLSGLPMKDAGRAVGAGGLVGAAGGMLGLAFGQAFYGPLARIGTDVGTPAFIGFMLVLIGRSVGWALIGLFIGATQGIAFGSLKRMINGGIGGFLGGAAGGAAFEILNQMNAGGAVAFSGEILRFIGLATTGAGIGLFIGLFEELFKQAWVIVLRGKNEGREFILHKTATILGRDELADVPVFGDTSVAPQHAEIRLENNRYVLRDLGAPFGTMLNGDRITTQQLRDGDLIELGSMRIAFHEKATASRVPRYVDKAQQSRPQIPTSQHVCQFCGSIKDASGNCQCSVANVPSSTVQNQAAQPASDPFSSQSMNQPAATDAVPAASGTFSLIGISGTYIGQSFPVVAGDNSIGRDAAKMIPLSLDNTVSRTHARITLEAGQFVIYDEGSSNGTYVNGARIQRQPLKSGDTIQIGSTQFRFEE